VKRKIRVKRETIRVISAAQLGAAHGAGCAGVVSIGANTTTYKTYTTR